MLKPDDIFKADEQRLRLLGRFTMIAQAHLVIQFNVLATLENVGIVSVNVRSDTIATKDRILSDSSSDKKI